MNMSLLICPKGHESSESDFCSECGLRLEERLPKSSVTCPDCAAPKDTGDFCEVCGYNFLTGAHGELPVTKPAAPAVTSWELRITVDSTLKTEDSPNPPADFIPMLIRLKPGSSLIGRSSAKRAIHPEIALDQDDAVSHRHALLDLHADGQLSVRDIGSSNGTRLNGAEIKPLEDIALKDGDVLSLGHWTRVSIQAVI